MNANDLGPWIAIASLLITIATIAHSLIGKSRDRLSALQVAQIAELKEDVENCKRRESDCWAMWMWAQRNFVPKRNPEPMPTLQGPARLE